MKLAVCYYPEQCDKVQWKKDIEDMLQMGIQIVRIGEFTWSLLEPKDGDYQFQWLDEIIDMLGKAGLEIILGTPTAAPPKWLVDKYPEFLPYDIKGKQLKFGSRRHYTFSSEVYKKECKRIVTRLAQRYGKNPYVKGWQIDNEYGDHNTILSFGAVDRLTFQKWLKKRYKNIDSLNKTWGCVFWSMRYNDFEQIELPNEATEKASPTAWMDYYRFSSDNVIAFNKVQVEILRKYSPNRVIIHNYMSGTVEFDHYEIGKDLDIAAFDSYPLGSPIYDWLNQEDKNKFLRSGIPDSLAFYHDLYRRVGKGNLWIMEQQPGPVNWAKFNSSPLDGMVRLWTMEAFAHGAQVVSYFRWRQVPYAQEQFHTALKLPNGELDQAGIEVQQVFKELKLLPKGKKQQAEVGFLYDYDSLWALKSLPQGEVFKNPNRYSFEQYTALRSIGIDVDILSSKDDISGYKLLVLANSIIDNTEFSERLSKFDGFILIMARSASKTPDMWIPQQLPIGSLRKIINVQVNRVESLPEYHKENVLWQGKKYNIKYWRESIQTDKDTIIATFDDAYRSGYPALVEQEKTMYCACWPDKQFMKDIMIYLCKKANIPITLNLKDVRITKLGSLTFAFNYGNETTELNIPQDTKILIGNKRLEPADLCIWQTNNQ